jgi:hypothetical protein
MSRPKKPRTWRAGRAIQSKGDAVVEQRDIEWARQWFAGCATCPTCGGDELTIVATNSGGDTRLETWRCERRGCTGTWRVELRESAVAVFDSEASRLREWHERTALQAAPNFQIEIEDGIVRGVRTAEGSIPPEQIPRFRVREYESDGSLERDRVSGVDSRGREYSEHEIDRLDREF